MNDQQVHLPHKDADDQLSNPSGQDGDAELRLNAALKESEQYLAGWKRAVADFENYKKSEQRRINSLTDAVHMQVLKDTLPLYESLISAYDVCTNHVAASQGATNAQGQSHPTGNDDLCHGIIHMKRQFDSWYGSMGMRKIETKGVKYDPATCEVTAQRLVEGVETGTVIEEHASGYYYRDMVLRPAKVVVAK